MKIARVSVAGALIVCLLALVPVVYSKPLRQHYVQTVQRYIAYMVPPLIVLAGDSLTAEGFWHQDLVKNPLALVNLAEGGLTIAQVATQVAAAKSYAPRNILILAGTNDIVLFGRTTDEIRNDYDFLLSQTEREWNVVVTLIPYTSYPKYSESISNANAAITEVAIEHGAEIVDLNSAISDDRVLLPAYTTDGVHLSRFGYRIWADELRIRLSR
ncbi:SGNH/GDSL hydrolase family protein [Microbaculum marinum]|uniref:GDSL-type esterase/lipase family protein n=1 Tax=Microbaculum marinum TaxID=1764581 RepID=A0AAW9RGG0_9HYPH